MRSLKVIDKKSMLKQTGSRRKKAKICAPPPCHLGPIKRKAAELCTACEWRREKQGSGERGRPLMSLIV